MVCIIPNTFCGDVDDINIGFNNNYIIKCYPYCTSRELRINILSKSNAFNAFLTLDLIYIIS